VRVGGVDRELVRRLAGYESDGAPVLSVYLDLDPSEFALPHARSTEVRSLVDEAHRQIEDRGGLSHDQQARGLQAVKRVREWFEGPDFSPAGAEALGVFCAAGDGLFEVVRLPRSVPSDVMVGRKPFVEPLVDLAAGGGWCVLLADREQARILRGSVYSFDEVARIGENPARGQHDQGGLSQPRYQRSVEEDVDDHVKRTADVLYRRFKRAPFERLLIGARSEFAPWVEDRMHAELRARLVGRIDADVQNSTPDDVLAAASPVMEEQERRVEADALERLREGVPHGRGVTGLEDVLEVLTERRVETLLLEDGFSATGVACPRCGWLGGPEVKACPADGTRTETRDDVVDLAIGRTLGQSADVVVVRDVDAIEEVGGIAAVLRF
jgi:hypothetical protein